MIDGLVVPASVQMGIGGDFFDRVDWQHQESEFLSSVVQLGDGEGLAEAGDPWFDLVRLLLAPELVVPLFAAQLPCSSPSTSSTQFTNRYQWGG